MPRLRLGRLDDGTLRAIEAWRTDYNESGLHRVLGNRSRREFAPDGGMCIVGRSDRMLEALAQCGIGSG